MIVTDLAAAVETAKSRMSGAQTRMVRLDDLAAVNRLGARLAFVLSQGDVVLLRGDLGAGKTELARAIVQARIGAPVEVPSPTFTLVQIYDAQDLQIAHADLYRIEGIGELSELGLDEAIEQGALLVEWPDRAEGLWPPSRLEIDLTIDGEGPARIARILGRGAWAARLNEAFA